MPVTMETMPASLEDPVSLMLRYVGHSVKFIIYLKSMELCIVATPFMSEKKLNVKKKDSTKVRSQVLDCD